MSTVIRVPSLSQPHVLYDVVRDGDSRTCTHPFFKSGEVCKHMHVAETAEIVVARCAEHHGGDGQHACADCIAALVAASMRKVARGYVTKDMLKQKVAQVREKAQASEAARKQRAKIRRIK